MSIHIKTLLRHIIFSPKVQNLWDDEIVESSKKNFNQISGYRSEKEFVSWKELQEISVYRLFEKISVFYREENKKNLPDNDCVSFSILHLLKKDGVDITTILLNEFNSDPLNTTYWFDKQIFKLYLDFLASTQEFIPQELSNFLIEEIKEEKKYDGDGVDEHVRIFFKLIAATPAQQINYDWFIKNLDFFSLGKDSHTKIMSNHGKFLHYDCQKNIHDYIQSHFPDKLEENSQYYSQLLTNDIFSTQQLFQSSIEVNLYKALENLNLNEDKFHHLKDICSQCLKTVASQEFMTLINQNICLNNIYCDNKQSSIVLHFSTHTLEELNQFEKILLVSLQSVLPVQEKIKILFTDDYNSDENIMTNMNAKFIYQHYLHDNLHDILNKNTHSKRKNKI